MGSAIAPQFFKVEPGSVVTVGHEARRFKVTHLISIDMVLAVDLETAESCRLPIEQLRLAAEPKEATARDLPRDLSLYSDVEWKEAQRRLEHLKGLLASPLRTREEAEKAAAAAGVHVSTLYRWLNDYLRVGNVSALVPAKRGRKAGTKLLSDEREKVIDAVIERLYLSKQRHTPADAIDAVQAACRLAKLVPPHPNTVRARIKKIPEVIQLKRRGHKEDAANRFTPLRGSIQTATHPFAMLQIDHTPTDIIVVDEVHRQPMGRPYLTLAIDVYSRMVAGFYLSMDPPSSASVALCLAHAICPKRAYLAELGLPGTWPVWGTPRTVHVDNAKEFRGQALERGAEQHGIDLEWRPVKDPKYGGHIERLVGTVMRWIHSLPGTTFSNTRQRKGYDSEAESALTLRDLEIELADLLVNKYHLDKHDGIGIPPIKKWERGIIGTDDQPGLGLLPIPEDPLRLLIDFMPMETRTVQRYGIQWDNITYYDPILDSFINACGDDGETKEKFTVRRDPRDISRIYFYNPHDKSYTVLPYRNIGHPPMSLYELNEIRRRLTEEGIKHIDEEMIFERLERSRKRIAEAVHKSKSARRAQARSHKSVQAKAPAAPTVRKPAAAPGAGSAPPPEPRLPKPAANAVEDDIFADPVRPFDELGMRR